MYSPLNECWWKTSCMASPRPSLKPSRVFPDGSWCKLLCLTSSTALQPSSQTGTSSVGAPVLLIYGIPPSLVVSICNTMYWVLSTLSHLILTPPPQWYHCYLIITNERTCCLIFKLILQVVPEYIILLNIIIL